jgi:hypothetical protein
MAAANAVPGFRPSEHGLHFPNRFGRAAAVRLPLGPLGTIPIGNAANGLCGGMCRFVRDRWEAGESVPATRRLPGDDTALFRSLARGQVLSLDWFRAPLRFYSLQAIRPERNDPLTRLFGRHTRSAETVRQWYRIRRRIDDGCLAIVGVLRTTGIDPFELPRHHQVVAYGYEVEGDRLRLQVYDPNHPDRDDVELRLRLGPDGRGRATMLQTTGEPVEAFLLLD